MTGPMCAPPGDDVNPLPDDRVILTTTQGEGAVAAIAAADTKNEGITEPGERRIYSRNPGGDIVSAVYLKGDGSVEITATGSIKLNTNIELKANGEINLNGVIIGVTGSTTFPIAAAVKMGPLAVNMVSHIHTNTAGPTGPPQAGTP